MYTEFNFKTKKALKEAVARGENVLVFEPGIQTGQVDGTVFLEGPHYPQPHTWYAQAEILGGVVVKIK